MSRRKAPESSSPGAPMWFMSFSDMMTNLLCFFILLCAFATDPRAGFISDGIGSIKTALMSNGLPGVLHGDERPLDLGAGRVLFRPSRSIFSSLLEAPDGTLTDANRDTLRNVVTQALSLPDETEIPLPMVFAPGVAKLTPSQEAVLREIAPRFAGGNYRIRAEGYAWKEGLSNREEWRLALERAQNVLTSLARSGDISNRRLVPVGYGPSLRSANKLSATQNRWGRRIVVLRVVGP